MDGYEIAEAACAPRGCATYLVALSGYGQAVDREHAHRAGFDIHLTKPAAMETLLEIVADAPRRGKKAGQHGL